jgi:hypothetical protein
LLGVLVVSARKYRGYEYQKNWGWVSEKKETKEHHTSYMTPSRVSNREAKLLYLQAKINCYKDARKSHIVSILAPT